MKCFLRDNPNLGADEWKALSEKEKEKYKAEAAEEKERHKKEMEEFNDTQTVVEKAVSGKKERRGGKG